MRCSGSLFGNPKDLKKPLRFKKQKGLGGSTRLQDLPKELHAVFLNHRFHWFFLIPFFSGWLFLTGCVNLEKTYNQYDLAQKAYSVSDKVGALHHSPKLFYRAHKYLRKGELALKERDYKKATKLFKKSRYYSEKAENRSRLKMFKKGAGILKMGKTPQLFQVVLVVLLVPLTGCLKTRSQLKKENQKSSQTSLTQYKAQMQNRFFELDRDFRKLYGKIEVLEKKVLDIFQKKEGGPEKPENNLEQRISTLEKALLTLNRQISQVRGSKRNKKNKKGSSTDRTKGPFSKAESLFAKGQFEAAIDSYDKYRKKYPKGKNYPQATFKMGLAFEKLNMPRDARAFYLEVMENFPKTSTSKKAGQKLKKLPKTP